MIFEDNHRAQLRWCEKLVDIHVDGGSNLERIHRHPVDRMDDRAAHPIEALLEPVVHLFPNTQ
jgi:hypothetical protein